MKLVIDANVVKAYFMESVLERNGELTSSTLPLFERLHGVDEVFLDENGQIKHEWRQLVDKEWFDIWYADLIRDSAAFEIPVSNETQLRNQIERRCGFSRGNKDFWYIKTAKAVTRDFTEAFLISEDMDFHDPTKKSVRGQKRVEILSSGRGRVVVMLRKEKIYVHCVSSYISNVQKIDEQI